MRTTGLLAPESSQHVALILVRVHIHTPDQNQAHLQQEFDLGLDIGLLAVREQLGTITLTLGQSKSN